MLACVVVCLTSDESVSECSWKLKMFVLKLGGFIYFSFRAALSSAWLKVIAQPLLRCWQAVFKWETKNCGCIANCKGTQWKRVSSECRHQTLQLWPTRFVVMLIPGISCLVFALKYSWTSSGLILGLSRMFPLYILLSKLWSYSCILVNRLMLQDRVLKPLAGGGDWEEPQQTISKGISVTFSIDLGPVLSVMLVVLVWYVVETWIISNWFCHFYLMQIIL